MAIRLVDEYPNRTGAVSSDYPDGSIINESTPGADDGTPLEQAWGNDVAGFMQALLESADISRSGNPDTVPNSQHTDALLTLTRGLTEVDVGGASNVTLSTLDSRIAIIRLIGTLSGDIDLIVPDTARHYVFINATSGSFGVTVKTSAGKGIPVAQGDSEWLYSDGTNVERVLGARQTVQLFESSGTWTKPDGCRFVEVEVQAGGGGGGGASATGSGNLAVGGSGASGGYTRKLIDVSDISSASITVGAAGASGPSGNNPGGDGGNSNWDDGANVLSASGGLGGEEGLSSSGNRAIEGADEGASASGGDINIPGSGGNPGVRNPDSTIPMSGSGADSPLGLGGKGRGSAATRSLPGVDATGYGAGGSGGANGTDKSALAGGAGAPGIVIVREFY